MKLKKSILSIGSLVIASIPLAVVVACNDDEVVEKTFDLGNSKDKESIAKLKKDLYAFFENNANKKVKVTLVNGYKQTVLETTLPVVKTNPEELAKMSAEEKEKYENSIKPFTNLLVSKLSEIGINGYD